LKTLSSAITNLKNQLAVSGAWLTIMGIYYPDRFSPTVAWQYVNDNSDLTIGAPTGGGEYSKWFKAAFQVQQITEEVQMSLPKITITIYEPEPIPEYPVNLKDALQLYGGLSGGTVVLRRIYHSQAGVVTDVGIRQEFTILDVAMTDTVISLSVGIADPLARRFQRDNYGALTCRHKYKGGFCRYEGELKTCTHTLEDAPDDTPGCRSHNNSHQFGGSPGAAESIFYTRR